MLTDLERNHYTVVITLVAYRVDTYILQYQHSGKHEISQYLNLREGPRDVEKSQGQLEP